MAATEKKKHGRPTKLEEVAAAKIVAALKGGAFRKVASAWAGISERTMREWMALGKAKPTSPYGAFRRNVIEAETGAEIFVGGVAFKGASSDPEYALRYMAIRWRKRWNPRHQVTVSGDPRAPLQVESSIDLSRLSDDDLDKLEAITTKAAAAAATDGGDSTGESAEEPARIHPPDVPGSL